MLFVRECGAFARRAARHQKIDSRFDLPLDQRSQRGFIERTIALKWSDKRRACTGKHCISPSSSERRTAKTRKAAPAAAARTLRSSTEFAQNLLELEKAFFAGNPARCL